MLAFRKNPPWRAMEIHGGRLYKNNLHGTPWPSMVKIS
jgi:hypothetical protein